MKLHVNMSIDRLNAMYHALKFAGYGHEMALQTIEIKLSRPAYREVNAYGTKDSRNREVSS